MQRSHGCVVNSQANSCDGSWLSCTSTCCKTQLLSGLVCFYFQLDGKVYHTAADDCQMAPRTAAMLFTCCLQDPLQAITAAKNHRARQAATAAAEALTHQATAVAASPCRVLVLSAEGLRRFGRRVRAPLAALAADRREFLQQRRTAVHVSTHAAWRQV
jgi:hypothetical protein